MLGNYFVGNTRRGKPQESDAALTWGRPKTHPGEYATRPLSEWGTIGTEAHPRQTLRRPGGVIQQFG
jgi:hypothetical protein